MGTKSAKAACPAGSTRSAAAGSSSGTILDSFINSTYPVDSKDKGKAPDDGWKVRIRHTDAGGSRHPHLRDLPDAEPAYHKEKRPRARAPAAG